MGSCLLHQCWLEEVRGLEGVRRQYVIAELFPTIVSAIPKMMMVWSSVGEEAGAGCM